jgi:putative phosphoribosyl transferase
MVIQHEAIFQNRKHAAYLLGERLMEHKNTDAVIMAVPGGGIHMGSYLAGLLGLPLDVIPCKKIRHPADTQRTIGAVSKGAVVLQETGNEFPQDYIYHQIQLLQHVIRLQDRNYDKERTHVCLQEKTVIIVDDMLKTGDTMLACLQSIRKKEPARIVVAVPNVTPEATRRIADYIDSIIYLTIEPNALTNLYADFPAIEDEEVVRILRQSKMQKESE